MNETANTGVRRFPGAPPVTDTASITSFCQLAWLGFVWLATAVVVIGIIVVIGITGSLDQSLWQDAAANWQQWVVLAAGFTATATFAPMLMSNGVTRSRLSASVIVSMAVVATCGALVIVAGYAIEGFIFDRHDWPQVLDNGDGVGSIGTLARLGLQSTLFLCCAFASGWLMGLAFYQCRRDTAFLLVIPSLVPLALAEVLLIGTGVGMGIGGLRGSAPLPIAVSALGLLAVIAVAALVGDRATRGLELRN